MSFVKNLGIILQNASTAVDLLPAAGLDEVGAAALNGTGKLLETGSVSQSLKAAGKSAIPGYEYIDFAEKMGLNLKNLGVKAGKAKAGSAAVEQGIPGGSSTSVSGGPDVKADIGDHQAEWQKTKLSAEQVEAEAAVSKHLSDAIATRADKKGISLDEATQQVLGEGKGLNRQEKKMLNEMKEKNPVAFGRVADLTESLAKAKESGKAKAQSENASVEKTEEKIQAKTGFFMRG